MLTIFLSIYNSNRTVCTTNTWMLIMANIVAYFFIYFFLLASVRKREIEREYTNCWMECRSECDLHEFDLNTKAIQYDYHECKFKLKTVLYACSSVGYYDTPLNGLRYALYDHRVFWSHLEYFGGTVINDFNAGWICIWINYEMWMKKTFICLIGIPCISCRTQVTQCLGK